jgi:cytochrome o ubiquinol oxidase operon protein cyoD
MSSDNNMHKMTSGTKTLKAYVVGLILCLVLTFASFGLAWMHFDKSEAASAHLFSYGGIIITLMLLAVIQLFVQVVCFLRLNGSRDGRWELMPFLFTIFIVLVIAGGSLWIMWNLNYYMMH